MTRNLRSARVVTLLTSLTVLSACDQHTEVAQYASVQDCIDKGYRMEQCQQRTVVVAGSPQVVFVPYMPFYYGWFGYGYGWGSHYYAPTVVNHTTINNTSVSSSVSRSSASVSSSSSSAVTRGGFGSTGAAHATSVGVGE